MYEVLTVKLNLQKHMKSKPRTPAYVEEVYHRIEVEMCTARNAVVALDLRIGHIVANAAGRSGRGGSSIEGLQCERLHRNQQGGWIAGGTGST